MALKAPELLSSKKMKNKNELLLHSKTSSLADMNALESPAVHNYESFYWVISKLCPALNTNTSSSSTQGSGPGVHDGPSVVIIQLSVRISSRNLQSKLKLQHQVSSLVKKQPLPLYWKWTVHLFPSRNFETASHAFTLNALLGSLELPLYLSAPVPIAPYLLTRTTHPQSWLLVSLGTPLLRRAPASAPEHCDWPISCWLLLDIRPPTLGWKPEGNWASGCGITCHTWHICSADSLDVF